VDRAHALGLGVILDVVYNHLGPDGNYLKQFSPAYFTDRYKNEWGEPINFDGKDAGPVREFFAANAGYWIDEFHLDGLRLDATQQIFDASPVSIVREVGESVRRAARGRATIVVAENEPQDASLVRPVASGGGGLDGLWNDDFHHSTHVALTARNEAYYSDYLGTPQELVSAVKRGFLYQGQWYAWQKQPRGTPAFDIAPSSFVHFIQNHDQIANSASGLRVHELAAPGRYRAITALLLLAPQTPMFFQGQEFAASSPFLFFADHKPDLARAVRKGRADFLRQFPSVAMEEAQRRLPDPADPRTFERCKLDLAEREKHADAVALHRDLLALRRDDPAFARAGGLDGAVIGPEAFVLRFFAAEGDRLLVVNLGRDLRLESVAEPLLAPPASRRWAALWSSDDLRYGGSGTPPLLAANGWRFPGHAAVLLQPEANP
jgi:maltooligosyltrehalose trehalohydrolase